MSEQLWPENGPPLLADVEILVSGVAFKAHRANSETGRVEIIDVLAETFADFLKFVYTGQLDTPCLANSQLGDCADKYDVEALSDLCNGLSLANMDPDSFKSELMTSEDCLDHMYKQGFFMFTFSS